MKNYIKSLLEFFFYLLFSTKTNKIYKKIKKYDIVSFDIFDTLIKRKVKYPDDIFDIIEQEYNKKYEKINNFKKNRINAYKKALKNSTYEDISLNEIYDYMDAYSNEQKKKLFCLEVEIEKKYCFRNEKIYDCYIRCLNDKKNIIIISDMYLPFDVIKEILSVNGYDKYKKLYISSTERITKKTGNLFKKVINEINIIPTTIVHIGDSPLSDFINPRKYKINSILIKK